ncbi:MAG: polysaccharide biosynthesis C-terminal domain-containing protein [Candidatus Latescibacterota bacterium]|nr:polysaccharide biosynthesis C-terminal domain-containing protein [Candidatus Latescibacterota bacterium]
MQETSDGLEDWELSQKRDYRDLARGGLITFVGKIGRASRGAFLWIITFFMGLDVQGYYSLSWGIVSTLNKIAQFGMERSIVRFSVRAREQALYPVERVVVTGLGIVFISATLVMGGVFAFSNLIADFYNKPIAEALRILSFSAPFLAMCWVFMGAIRSLRIVIYDVYVLSIAGPLLLLIGGLCIGIGGGELRAVAYVQVSMAVGIFALSVFFFSRLFSFRECWQQLGQYRPWKDIAYFSLPVTAGNLLYGVLTQLDVLMLGFFVSAEMVGIYALARRIASLMLKASQAFDPIFSSIVSELAVKKQYSELNVRFQVLFRWILTINLPIFFALLMIGDVILALIGGGAMNALPIQQIERGINVLLILCICMMIQGLFALTDPLLTMVGKPSLNFFNNLVWLISNFIINVALIEYFNLGIVGAALGALFSTILVNGLRTFQIYSEFSVSPFGVEQLKPICAAILAGLTSWLIRQLVMGDILGAVVTLFVFFLTYIMLLRVLGLEIEDKQLLTKFFRWVQRNGDAVDSRKE